MMWDRGNWIPDPRKDPRKTLEQGQLHFTLEGERMKGEWIMIRLKPRPGEKNQNWILRKIEDEHAGAADLVDRGRLGGAGEAGAERRVAGGRLPEAGGKDAAHEDLVHLFAGNAGALDRGLDGGGAQLCRARAGKAGLEAPHRGAGVGEDDDRIGCHVDRSSQVRSSRAQSRGARDESVPAPLDFARDERARGVACGPLFPPPR